jgi:hypothetical protein
MIRPFPLPAQTLKKYDVRIYGDCALSGLKFICISLRRALPYATDKGLSALVADK